MKYIITLVTLFLSTLTNGQENSLIDFNTDLNWQQVLQKAKSENKLVFVDIFTDWCGPCKMIGPVVEQLAGEYEGKAVIGKMDVDMNSAIPAKFGIRSIPTLMIFKNGQLVDKVVGVVPKTTLEDKLNAQIEATV